MLRVNTPPFLSSNHTHREALTVWNRQSPVPCAHCLRRDSGQATPAQRPTWDFPILSLGSHSPPGEASSTQQQGAPQLIRQSPTGHTAGPGPAPLRAECPPLPQGLISVSEVEAKSPGAQCRIQTGIICGLCTFLGRRPTRDTEERVCWGKDRKHAWAKCLMISCEAWVKHK